MLFASFRKLAREVVCLVYLQVKGFRFGIADNLRDAEDEVPVENFLRTSHHSHSPNFTT
jgi:hypothetical protein